MDSLTDRLLLPSEAAAYLRVDPRTVTRWARAGSFPETSYGRPGAIFTPGGHARIRESVVRGLVDGTITRGDDDGHEG